MKVRFAVIFAAGLALILAGCSEIQESDNCVLSTEIPEGYGAVQIKLNSQSARTIRPFDLNDVERWNLYFTGSGNFSESFSRDISREMIESPILVRTWSSTNSTFIILNFPLFALQHPLKEMKIRFLYPIYYQPKFYRRALL